jgi:UDP-N-acetylmuramoyl-tripeptide--D-alanyl-D-alanine ligase
MKPLTIQQIRRAVGGKILVEIPSNAPRVMAVCTDSRQMQQSSLFVPIRGDHHDAHRFLPDAAAGGAVAALVDHVPDQPMKNVVLIHVADTRKALGRLARHVRRTMRSKVVAVAGSNGKTSTKHLIDAAIGGYLRGSISPKSYNNDIGVPLTIFPADPKQDYLVLEIGTNHHGEILPLAEMASPDIAVITNCGAEHLEGLEDLKGVCRENATIIEGLNPNGSLIVNGDDRELLEAVGNYPGERITFGFGAKNDLIATHVVCTERGTEFSLIGVSRRIFVPMLGRHSACNALAAIAVGRKLCVPDEAIFDGLSRARGPEMRLELSHVGDVTVLNDAYNANPNSMKAAIDTLAALATSGRRIAVLGEMRELGSLSEKYHREVGEYAAAKGTLDLLICVGDGGAWIADAAKGIGVVYPFADSSAVAEAIGAMLLPGDLILLKASRGVRLEKVAAAISQHWKAAGSAALS